MNSSIKFAVALIKGDNEKVLGIYDNKEDAKVAGKFQRKQYKREEGIVYSYSARFDENNNRVDESQKIYDIWN